MSIEGAKSYDASEHIPWEKELEPFKDEFLGLRKENEAMMQGPEPVKKLSFDHFHFPYTWKGVEYGLTFFMKGHNIAKIIISQDHTSIEEIENATLPANKKEFIQVFGDKLDEIINDPARKKVYAKASTLFAYIQDYNSIIQNKVKLVHAEQGDTLLRLIEKDLDRLGVEFGSKYAVLDEMAKLSGFEGKDTIQANKDYILTIDMLQPHLPIFARLDSGDTYEKLLLAMEHAGHIRIGYKEHRKLIEDLTTWNQGNTEKVIYRHLIQPYLVNKQDDIPHKTVLDYVAKKRFYTKDAYAYTLSDNHFDAGGYQYILDFGSLIDSSVSEEKQLVQKKDIFRNALGDFNVTIDVDRKPKDSDYMYIPHKDTYYTTYISNLKSERKKRAKNKEKIKIITGKESISSIDESLFTVVEEGRNSFMISPEKKKLLQREINFMKKFYLDKSYVGTQDMGVFDYVQEQINQSTWLTSPTLKRLIPFIPFQESKYDTTRKSTAEAEGIWQWIPGSSTMVKPGVPGDIILKNTAERKDIVKSTEKTLRWIWEDYNILLHNNDFVALAEKYEFDRKDKDVLVSLMAINAHNCGINHMTNVLRIMNNHTTAEVNRYVKKYRAMGFFMYITDEYPKLSAKTDPDTGKTYQSAFVGQKYLQQAPEYLYYILGYYTQYTFPKRT